MRPRLPLVVPFLLILTSAAWSDGTATDIAAQAIFTVAIIVATSIQIDEKSFAVALAWIFILGVLTVGITLITNPGEARLAGRLTGPAVNPNTLGALISVTFPAAIHFAPRLAIPLSGVALGVVWETGSRASLIAVLLEILILGWSRIPSAARPFAILISLAAFYQVAPGLIESIKNTGAGSESVLRSNNSRDIVWQQSMTLIREHPWRGYGLGAPETRIETGSSLFSAAILGGLTTLAITAACLLHLLLKSISRLGLRDWRTVTLVGGLINASFEGWLLAAGSAFCLIYWMVASSALSSADRRELDEEPIEPTKHGNTPIAT